MTPLQFTRSLAAVLVLAAAGTAAVAQSTPTPPVLTDAAPLPPEDRNSVGAIVLDEAPVIAKREYLESLAAARMQTSVMGNSAAPVPPAMPDPVERPARKPSRSTTTR